MERYFLISAVLVALSGAASDVRTKRIPNWLTYSALMAALLIRFTLAGWTGLESGVFGMAAAGGIFFVLFVLKAMGGGDLKLMAAVAAWAGSEQVVTILLASALAGGVLAVVYAVAGRRVRQTVLNTMELVGHHLNSGLQPHPSLNVRDADSMRVPYGLAIAIGTIFCAGNALWWR